MHQKMHSIHFRGMKDDHKGYAARPRAIAAELPSIAMLEGWPTFNVTNLGTSSYTCRSPKKDRHDIELGTRERALRTRCLRPLR